MINPTATIIDEVENYLSRFIVYPHHEAKYAHVLWILHTHLMDEWETTPRLAFLSPEPGSGKTRALEITALLVPNAVESANQTAAYIARKVSNQSDRPTLLLDEVDAIFSDTRTVNEDLRAVLNAGYRKRGKVGKCLQTPNGNFIANDLCIYCAVVLASLNVIPNTLADRSIIIAMKKRAAKERVESYRVKKEEDGARALKEKIQEWAKAREQIGQIEPDLPELISDRQADIWEPLIIIADLAGQEFGARARESATKIIMESRKKKPTLGIQLLGDIKSIFGDEQKLSTHRILNLLNSKEDAPWGTFSGKQLSSHELARLLKPYDIAPKTIRVNTNETVKGYERSQFLETWERYLIDSPSIPQSP